MNKYRLHIFLIINVFICSLVILLNIIPSLAGNNSILRVQDVFESEKAYTEYISTIHFSGINIGIHTIEPGDNFWKIARKYGVTIDTLIGANPHWENLKARTRQKILVPSQRGVIHLVNDRSATDELALMYGVEKQDIILQDMSFGEAIRNIFSFETRPLAVFIRQVKPRSDFLTDNLARQFELRERFHSPLGGRFSSYYGSRKHPIFSVNSFHNGVDIAAPQGSMVGSADDGVVIDAGWMGGYGKAVMIRHKDGYRTLYGHLSRITTSPGQHVKAGNLIGRVGSTGLSTGPHLHFTIWQGERLINPLKILW